MPAPFPKPISKALGFSGFPAAGDRLGFWILGFGFRFWVLDFGFWFLGFGFWFLGFGLWVWIWGFGLRVLELGFWILGHKGLGYEVLGSVHCRDSEAEDRQIPVAVRNTRLPACPACRSRNRRRAFGQP